MAAAANPGHRVLLVREWDSQHSGSGCCGRLGTATSDVGGAASFAGNRCRMEEMGAVYRQLRATFPRDSVDVTVVDPRNSVWLIPTIWRDARRRGMSRGDAWDQVRRGVSRTAIVVDGRVLFSGDVPQPQVAVDAVLAELGRRP